MKQKLIPILFSTMMVQAILRLISPKLVTRRTSGLKAVNKNPDYWKTVGSLYVNSKGKLVQKFESVHNVNVKEECECPYGQPGDILWVRETFVTGHEMEDGYFKFNEDGDRIGKTWYRASDPELAWYDGNSDFPAEKVPWKPSIHMPYAACRIWIKNKSVRCERLHDITEEECILEGVEMLKTGPKILYKDYLNDTWLTTAYESFKTLWIKINGPESWDKNDWLWRVEFERTEKPEVV